MVLKKELKRRLKNLKQYDKNRDKKNKVQQEEQKTQDDYKRSMQNEISKNSPSILSLKKDLEALRKKRKEELRGGQTGVKHLEEYPALTIPKLVSFNI